MSRPRVSIVTPSFNQAPFLERALRSVLCQDYCDIEYIVLDACSADGTSEILHQYAAALDVLVVEKDDGQADALNHGFARATGDILGFLNTDDCFVSAQTIAQVVRRFNDNPTVDVIYGQRDCIDEQGRFLHDLPFRRFCAQGLRRANYIPQEATFWRRGIYEAAGGYVDPGFSIAMDYDLWLRFLSVGARFLAVPERWGLFRMYPEQKTKAAWRERGLPEVWRLQDAHLGFRVAEQEMYDQHAAHLYGARPFTEPVSFKFAQEAWNMVQDLKRAQLGDRPLDDWVFHTNLNASRLEKMCCPGMRRTAAA